jgi:hypothetical protein
MDVEEENSANRARPESSTPSIGQAQIKPGGSLSPSGGLSSVILRGGSGKSFPLPAPGGGAKATLFFELVVTGPGKPATEPQIAG